MQHLIESFAAKFVAAFQTLQGWLAALLLLVVDYFAGHKFIMFFVLAVTVLDAIWGIIVSIKRGQFTLSELARLTVVKMAVYGTALFVFVGIDKITDTMLGAAIVGSVIALVELWSSCASMLILYPHMPLLRLLKKALAGEIAAKLHIDPEEVEDVLEERKIKKVKK